MRTLPLLAAALAALAFCGPAGAGQGAVVEVDLLAGSFSPEALEVAPGDVVVWRNADGRAHTVTSAWDGGATFNKVLRPGESFSARLMAEGEYAIRCVPHSAQGEHGGHVGMVQTVRVASAAPPAEAEPSGGGFGTSRLVLLSVAAAVLAGGAFWLNSAGAFALPRARPPRRL